MKPTYTSLPSWINTIISHIQNTKRRNTNVPAGPLLPPNHHYPEKKFWAPKHNWNCLRPQHNQNDVTILYNNITKQSLRHFQLNNNTKVQPWPSSHIIRLPNLAHGMTNLPSNFPTAHWSGVLFLQSLCGCLVPFLLLVSVSMDCCFL